MIDSNKPTVYIVIGVSGSGKSTIGIALAEQRGIKFVDGDDFHPSENIDKMSRGVPLNDQDRHPWLEKINQAIGKHLAQDDDAVFAVSALKKKYRDQLRLGNDGVRFVYLNGSFDLISLRMSNRKDHFMKSAMLQSQFDAFEAPISADVVTVGIDQSVENIVKEISSKLV